IKARFTYPSSPSTRRWRRIVRAGYPESVGFELEAAQGLAAGAHIVCGSLRITRSPATPTATIRPPPEQRSPRPAPKLARKLPVAVVRTCLRPAGEVTVTDSRGRNATPFTTSGVLCT